MDILFTPLSKIFARSEKKEKREMPSKEDEELNAEIIRSEFTAAIRSGVNEMGKLIPEVGNNQDALVDRCLEAVIGWTFPFRTLIDEKKYSQFLSQLRFSFFYDDRTYPIMTDNANDSPGLRFNLKMILKEKLKIPVFKKNGSAIETKAFELSTNKYMRLAGVEEGSHTLVRFFSSDKRKQRLTGRYKQGMSFPLDKQHLFFNQPLERRADYLKARYIRLYYSADPEFRDKGIYSSFLQESRVRD